MKYFPRNGKEEYAQKKCGVKSSHKLFFELNTQKNTFHIILVKTEHYLKGSTLWMLEE